MTLDTDAGTLSFSSWKDGTNVSSLSVDPLIQNIVSPRKSGQTGGTVEDWGVAFEGLPLDAKLYPAIALYQRDDRVTLLAVESPTVSRAVYGSNDISGGECYYPLLRPPSQEMAINNFARDVRQHNDQLTWEGIRYATSVLERAVTSIKGNDLSNVVLTSILPSLGASLCLLPPSVPILSARFASYLMPYVSTCILELERILLDVKGYNASIFDQSVLLGRWIVRTKNFDDSIEDEEYEIDITTFRIENESTCFEGKCTPGILGKSKGASGKVIGCVNGSSVTFVEDWYSTIGDEASDDSRESDSFVITARLSIDGRAFEGIYRRSDSGSSGHITGRSLNEMLSAKPKRTSDSLLCACAALLCSAQSHLAVILGDAASSDLEYFRDGIHCDTKEDREKQFTLKTALSRPLLSIASLRRSKSEINDDISSLLQKYCPPKNMDDDAAIYTPSSTILENLIDFTQDVRSWEHDSVISQELLSQYVASVDSYVTPLSGGRGSFSGLCPTVYSDARKQIVCTILHHSGLDETSDDDPAAWTPHLLSCMQLVWRSSLRILDDGIRNALSLPNTKSAREKCSEVCQLYSKTSEFLLSLTVKNSSSCTLQIQEVTSEISFLFSEIGNESELKFLQAEMVLATKRALLRYSSLSEIVRIVSVLNTKSLPLIESFIVALPRQLGRGKVERNHVWRTVKDDNLKVETLPYLDGNYLYRLDGSNHQTVAALRKLIITLFANLGRISEQLIVRRSVVDFPSKSDSLILSLLAAFITHLRREDFDDIINESHLLVFLPKILTMNRASVLQTIDTTHTTGDSHLRCLSLVNIFQRDVSRAILRCSVALVYVITYQGTINESTTSSGCVDLVLRELEHVFPLVKQDLLQTFEEDMAIRSKNDWQYYVEPEENSNTAEISKRNGRIYFTGLGYLEHHGSLLTSFSHTVGTKSTQSIKAAPPSPTRQVLDINNHSNVSFAQHLLSHWLHIICSILRSPVSTGYILTHTRGLSLLLSQIGLAVECSTNGIVQNAEKTPATDLGIPGRFRSRLIRLMLPLVSSMTASKSLVREMFFNAGSNSSMLIHCKGSEDWIVSREIISLLRHLYSPSHPLWKECIDDFIATIAQGQDSCAEVSFLIQIGILSFISGNLGVICRGSYVLIKPLAASALSSETQSLASGKSHLNGIGGSSLSSGGSGSNLHHLVGNGTNSVVTGFCGVEASAGIVSNIDLKNGSCEVILVARSPQELGDKGSSIDAKNFKPSSRSRNFVGGRHTLTVRAVRTALNDVVHAQEVPLCLEESNSLEPFLAAFLPRSLERLKSVASDDESVALASDLLILRCCIVLWSHERMLSIFLSRPFSKSILYKLLEIAWPQDGIDAVDEREIRRRQSKSISQLVNHEARFNHVVCLLRDLNLRMLAMKDTSEIEKESRLKNIRWTTSDDAPVGVLLETPVVSEGTISSQTPSSSNELRALVREDEVNTGRSTSHSTTTSSADDEEENSEAAATATAHLREAAIAQMAELGLPRSWSEYALQRTGGVNIEAAVTFCLERGPEIERMIADEQERDRMSHRDFSSGSVRRRANRDNGPSSRLMRQLLEMGFPKRWCSEALSVTGNNVDEALTWILSNGERLSEEDEAIEAGEENEGEGENDTESVDDEDDEEDDEIDADERQAGGDNEVFEGENSKHNLEHAETIPRWSGSVTPLSFISGRAIVDPTNMEISGLPNGGFSSVGTKGILLCTGQWYYEAILETAGCLQIGWADGSFAGHCHAERGDGCGDGPSSWAFDGWRRYRWHATATEWGCRWKEGDVVGCLVDMDSRIVSFTLNGEGESIGMGVAFTAEGFRPCGGVYACVSFNRKEKLRLILGGSRSEPFKYQPPAGYRGVGEAVLDAVEEHDLLLTKERILDLNPQNEVNDEMKRFLCDFSDTDHGHELTAWAHRYYGSDASVHLGSGRSKHSSSKHLSNYSAYDQWYSPYLTRRLQREWGQTQVSRKGEFVKFSTYTDVAAGIFDAYDRTQKSLKAELATEYATIGCLLAKKLLLHLVITSGQYFDLNVFMKENENPVAIALRFFNVVEVCTSLRNAGWVGEAGAMAIAAEALGLCISSNDQIQPRSNSDRRGVVIANDLDENLQLPVGGYTQMLTSVLTPTVVHVGAVFTCHFKSAVAEAAIGSDGGSGILSFLQEGLQAAAVKSKHYRDVIVAKIRRSVRLLAVVEYDFDEREASEKREVRIIHLLSSPQISILILNFYNLFLF